MTHGTASKMTTGQFREFAGAILRSLPDDLEESIVQGWIESQESLRRVLREALSLDTKIDFPVFLTITLGSYETVEDLRKCLERQKVRVSDWASDLMDQSGFTLASQKTEVNLVKVSVAELGFGEGAYYEDICSHAQKLGLDLCPAEVGPALRYQYSDQPRGEWLTIAMEPIADSDGLLHLFCVDHAYGGRCLGVRWGRPGLFWYDDDQFVFAR